MLVVENRLPVAEGREDEFVDLFRERTALAAEQPGFHRLQLLRPNDGREFVVQAYWDSREAFEAWRSSEAFQLAHEDIPEELFDGSNQLRIYDVVTQVTAGSESLA